METFELNQAASVLAGLSSPVSSAKVSKSGSKIVSNSKAALQRGDGVQGGQPPAGNPRSTADSSTAPSSRALRAARRAEVAEKSLSAPRSASTDRETRPSRSRQKRKRQTSSPGNQGNTTKLSDLPERTPLEELVHTATRSPSVSAPQPPEQSIGQRSKQGQRPRSGEQAAQPSALRTHIESTALVPSKPQKWKGVQDRKGAGWAAQVYIQPTTVRCVLAGRLLLGLVPSWRASLCPGQIARAELKKEAGWHFVGLFPQAKRSLCAQHRNASYSLYPQ